jgi:AcrR family transcriptional regulator
MNHSSCFGKSLSQRQGDRMSQSRVRPARADAVRNRANILEAARRQITMRGPDVGMDQIAGAAGVAVGTLYRHFPTKSDLVAAVISEFVAQVADDAEAAVRRVDQGSPAFVELAGLLRDIVLAAATNHAIRSLLPAARSGRAVRDDLSIDDFYLIVTNAPADQPPAVLHRWVDLTLFGIAGPARG